MDNEKILIDIIKTEMGHLKLEMDDPSLHIEDRVTKTILFRKLQSILNKYEIALREKQNDKETT